MILRFVGDSLVLFAENLYNGLVGYWPFSETLTIKAVTEIMEQIMVQL